MHYHNGVDASTPGARIPKGVTLLSAYIGEAGKPGAPDTPYIWTAGDFNLYLSPDSDLYAGPALRVLPIYTKSYPDDPYTDAQNACDAMRELGWDMSEGRILWWDAEALIDEAYCDHLAHACAAHGARLGKYGQLSTINEDPPVPGGTWFAAWQDTKPTHIPAGVGVMWQWASTVQVGGAWNLSIARDFVYRNAGRGPRRKSDS
jgi:hypothetical protein